jgi:hypothetical protein
MTSMDNTPDSPAKTPEGYTTQGGNFWTLITPEIWKVLHAVLQSRLYDDYQVEVPLIDWNGQKFVRISIQGYNSPEDVQALVEALAALLPR